MRQNDARGNAITPNGRRLCVTNAADGSVSVVDTKTSTVIDTIGGPGTAQVPAVTPDGNYAYVVFGDVDGVLVIDTATDAVITTIQWNTISQLYPIWSGDWPRRQALLRHLHAVE